MGNDKIEQYRGNGQPNKGMFGEQPHANPGQLAGLGLRQPLSAADVEVDDSGRLLLSDGRILSCAALPDRYPEEPLYCEELGAGGWPSRTTERFCTPRSAPMGLCGRGRPTTGLATCRWSRPCSTRAARATRCGARRSATTTMAACPDGRCSTSSTTAAGPSARASCPNGAETVQPDHVLVPVGSVISQSGSNMYADRDILASCKEQRGLRLRPPKGQP